jgi:hypothetical protein
LFPIAGLLTLRNNEMQQISLQDPGLNIDAVFVLGFLPFDPFYSVALKITLDEIP